MSIKKSEVSVDFSWGKDNESEITKDEDSLNEYTNEERDAMINWDGDDFPDKANLNSRGFNVILKGYENLRKKVFSQKQDYGEEYEPKCCDGIAGFFGLLFLLLADLAFVGYACYCNQLKTENDIRLLWVSVIVWVVILFKICRRLIRLGNMRGGLFAPFASCGNGINRGIRKLGILLKKPWVKCWERIEPNERKSRHKKSIFCKYFLIGIGLIFAILCLAFFVIMKDVRNMIPLSGMTILMFICIAISWHPGYINWQPVFVGLFIQLVFAVLTLQTMPGFEVFNFLGLRMTEFLGNSAAGSEFIFGDLHCFAFDVLPVVIFFSSFISLLFHLGIITLIIEKPSIVVTKIMKTTGPETLNAVANIFVSMTESPLLIRPYMHMMTNSELNSVMVNGFASVAGSVLAAYISFGVPPNHLLIACVMSAPAALGLSKVICPETKKAPLANVEATASVKSPYSNGLEAAMVGAMEAIPIVGGIAANLIGFLSIFNFFNTILKWLGERACSPISITFELVFSYVLWPIAFTMGIPQEDCFKVAELIGIKAMLNEFVAFERLGILIKAGEVLAFRDPSVPIVYLPDGAWEIKLQNGTTVNFPYGALHTRRAGVVCTYALCGFANVGSIGIMLGAMVTLLPKRRKDFSTMVLRAMIGGTIACFYSGCLAGLFYEEDI